MLCLGIETSCDETALALVEDGRLVAEKMASQAGLHALFGGVVPEMASREHLRLLDPLWGSLLAASRRQASDIDVVAVARGPGLLGALLMGVSFAKGLSLSLGCRLVGVDHLRAHLLAAGLERTIPFPCLGLLVSGGHTHLYHMVSQQEFVLLGRTLDDAAGEAFDKVARLLNLPYPGGVHVDRLARTAVDSDVLFPRPYLDNDNLDFSFSGLKTAVANHVRANPGYVLEAMPEPGQVAGMAAGNPALCAMLRDFNLAVAQTLRAKTVRALEACSDVRAVVVAGGVAANSFVREEFTELSDEHGLELVMPSPSLCTDNAAMIAHAGWLSARAGLAHGQDLEAVPRGRLVPWDYL